MKQLGRPITTILVDDHTLFRDGMRALLATAPDIQVVAEGRSGDDAIALTQRHQPDVVLLDVEMPGPPPHLVIPQIRASCPNARVIIVTMHGDPELAHELMNLGAQVYLVKNVSAEHVFGAIRTVMDDDTRTLLAVAKESLDSRYAAVSPAERPVLSAREVAVLELAARAMTNAQIGAALFIPEGTIRRVLSSTYRKLGASGRLDAINRAIASGLIRPAGRRSQDPASVRWPPERRPGSGDGRASTGRDCTSGVG